MKTRAAVTALSLSVSGLSYIQQHEGLVLGVYLDPVGIPTVCYGHMDRRLKIGTRYTRAQCEQFLYEDTESAQQAVKDLVTVPLTQNQYDALVSLVFNIGRPAFARSALLKKLNEEDYAGAAQEFPRWVYAKGQKLPGLVTRRNSEMELFLR